MKKILYILGIASVFFLPSPSLNAQTEKVPDKIILSFKAGNAEELAKFFHTNVELIILDKEDVYSRAQAEQIIRKFFSDNKPEAFKFIHNGGNDDSRYAIGRLTTSDKSYRVYLLMKKQEGTMLIHQLRIEEENKNAQ